VLTYERFIKNERFLHQCHICFRLNDQLFIQTSQNIKNTLNELKNIGLQKIWNFKKLWGFLGLVSLQIWTLGTKISTYL
jgi:hypothetical protein